ncbi:MAG: thioredoxin-dependent thiol peroxidase [Chitinophagaceae bacterium]|nr:thioredoxin-dependent thiol peroxidase [Chitinophagaceae bacterium]
MTSMLKKGDKAPSFTANDQNGEPVSLNDFKGKKLALFFYPKDDTPTCTKEACNLRDSYPALRRSGIAVLGVSIDTEKKHKKFEAKYELPFTLLADTDKKIVSDYGVWGMKQFMGREFMGTHRVTFLINEKGIIDHIIDKVTSGDHARQILDLWR